MKKIYHLSDSATMQMFARIGVLLACAAGAAAAVGFLGLQNWSRDQYPMVNIALLALAALGGFCLLRFGGALDGKPDMKQKSTKIAIAAGAAAAALWLFMTISGSHYSMSVIIFVADLVLAVALCRRFWDIIRNFWKDLLSETDGFGKALNYPGRYVLHDVRSDDALTSPFGQVLIGNNTVLFVLTDQAEGHILVRPNGTMEARKQKLLKNETKEINLDVSGMLFSGEQGAQRMMRIVEEECAKRGMEVPAMGYSYAMLLPNFEADNHFLSINAFRNVSWIQRDKRYAQYLDRAKTADYFSGRACFSTQDLQELLQQLDCQYAQDTGRTCTDAERNLVAQCIVDACQLVEKA